jgi:hypothetical protein
MKMKKSLLFMMVLLLGCTGWASALQTWSLNDDWVLNSNGFGADNAWEVRDHTAASGGDNGSLSAPFVDLTANYAPGWIAGYAAGTEAIFKVYGESDPPTNEIALPGGHVADINSGGIDLGDCASIAPGVASPFSMISWVAPRDMRVSAHVETYSVGTDQSEFHFVIRNTAGGPLNPEDIPERSFFVPGYNGTRTYVTADIAAFDILAGQEVMFWHHDSDTSTSGIDPTIDGIIGISEFTVTEVPEPVTFGLFGLGSLVLIRRRRRA